MPVNKQAHLQTLIQLRKQKERAVHGLLALVASISVLTILAIIWTLIAESWSFFSHVSLIHFLTHDEWIPLFEPPQYGILPLIAGTLTTTLVAVAVALPLGIIIASYLSEFASPKVRETLKPILEILAGVPTVVFGYFALLVVSPLLQKAGLPIGGFSMLSAGVVMGIMIIPYITSLTEDAMRSIAQDLREASFALGASRFDTTFKVVLPAAYSGVISAITLAISRALGETMIVAIAAGMLPKLNFNPLEAGQTLTAFIVQVSLGDAPHGSLGYQTIFVAGLVLFTMTLFLNLMAFYFRNKNKANK